MKIEVRPHGREVDRRFKELTAQGVPWSEAADRANTIEVNWPDSLRLPVPGDSLHLEGVGGPVERVTFILGADNEGFLGWFVSVKLG